MQKILVVGGAGFIGSHMVKMLGQRGCQVTTLDDLSSGHRDAVLVGDLVQGDMADRALLDGVLSRGFDAVRHFASFIEDRPPLHAPRPTAEQGSAFRFLQGLPHKCYIRRGRY